MCLACFILHFNEVYVVKCRTNGRNTRDIFLDIGNFTRHNNYNSTADNWYVSCPFLAFSLLLSGSPLQSFYIKCWEEKQLCSSQSSFSVLQILSQGNSFSKALPSRRLPWSNFRQYSSFPISICQDLSLLCKLLASRLRPTFVLILMLDKLRLAFEGWHSLQISTCDQSP